jgi:ionotropic glutamate receptor
LEPYVRFRWEPGLIGNQRYEGYYVDLLERLAEHANFEYQLQLAADGKVGQWNREDGWNGMLGELDRGVSDGGTE